MFLYPALEIAVKRDSNIFIAPNATSDTIWYLRPSVRLEAQQGVNIYSLDYRGDYGRYNSSTADNFNDHALAANANMTFDARNRLTAKLQYLNRVDSRGTLNVGSTPTPNEYSEPSVAGFYTYGAEDAQGKLELAGGYFNKHYLNNRSQTTQLDNKRADYGGTFLWRVQPRTYATFNLRQSKYHYTDPASTLDSTDTFMLLGVRWDATAATSGRFSVGRENKKFDGAGSNAGRQDYSGLSWEGGINWKPLTYSSVDYSTYRKTFDSTGLGDYTLTQTHQVVWTHAWSSRVTSTLTGLYVNDEYTRAPVAVVGGASREDTSRGVALRLTYNMRRWLNIGADFTHTNRDSNDPNFNYNRNQYMLFFAGTI
jgi:hypothetical protein